MSESVLLDEESTPLDLRLSDAELDRVHAHLTDFIADQVDAAGADGAVLGLSGGIDSTTVAYLAVDALGADSVRGLVMPGSVNTEENMSDAERVAEDLGIAYDVIEIEPIAEAFYDALPEAADEKMAESNVRVRVRAVLNYFAANADDRLVLGTGNRSEALTGYFTKYGDGAVDCNPLGNLYKQQVRQLAAHAGVPHDLVMKTPSAEMWTGQTDEEELGLDYDTLDAVLALHVDGPLSTAATVRALDVTAEEIARVEELYESSKHKRAMPPAPAELSL
ncbi:NAD+ synthase [Halobaculum magnesiiphilum]|uniref:NH(3)-dependent NAD(+) synthetase n=1 Tax=Halobaculum magnesiiphilum TaxID=1017351 RepID=A0A8T8W910_9EURY|nr:NAD+ synthase [Halobaculum magnesiiphilum]QZP36253.1 NAD+ synthase [Halobaculum magnesiiphilum]